MCPSGLTRDVYVAVMYTVGVGVWERVKAFVLDTDG